MSRFIWWLTFLALLVTAAESAAAQTIRVAHLRCENRIDPLGIDTAVPRLQWELTTKDA